MFWITPDRHCLLDACARAGLDFVSGRTTFRHRLLAAEDVPDWLRGAVAGGDRELRCHHVLKVPDTAPRLHRRPPAEVGVFEGGGLHPDVCVADVAKGGFGLDAVVGPDGGRFAAAYAAAAVEAAVAAAAVVVTDRVVRADGAYEVAVAARNGGGAAAVRAGPAGAVVVVRGDAPAGLCASLAADLARLTGRDVGLVDRGVAGGD